MQQSLCDERMSYPRHFSDVFGGFGDSQNGASCSEDVNKLKCRPKCKSMNKYTGGLCVLSCDDHYKHSLCALPRHFSDVFGGFNDSQNGASCSEDVNKLKRRPKCKTRNKYTGGSCVPLCDDYYRASLFALPYLTEPVIVPSLTNGCSASSDMDQLKLIGIEASRFVDISVPRTESLPVFDVLCLALQSSENITAHQAAALSRWLCHRQAVKTAYSSLVKILMASKCPIVSLVCFRMLKQSCVMSSVMSSSSATAADVISYVLFLQREMVKFLETGQFSINLMNVICLLDCITAMCHKIPAYYNKLHFSGHFYYQRCSSKLRWAMLTVISLANIISSKVKLTPTNSHAVDMYSNDDMQSVRGHVDRVPQIVSAMLSTSVYCEVAQVWSISRILNEYWHTTDFCQRRLIVDSVLVPKHRMELCTMILARHCGVLLQECFATSLSLDGIFSIFAENVVISAITQRVWMEDDGLSVVSHCREICFILCNAVFSYIVHQKETRGDLLHDDVMALQQLPNYVATVKKRLSEVCRGRHIMDVVSVSALDRLSCLTDVYSVEP